MGSLQETVERFTSNCKSTSRNGIIILYQKRHIRNDLGESWRAHWSHHWGGLCCTGCGHLGCRSSSRSSFSSHRSSCIFDHGWNDGWGCVFISKCCGTNCSSPYSSGSRWTDCSWLGDPRDHNRNPQYWDRGDSHNDWNTQAKGTQSQGGVREGTKGL